ncbi:baeRF7 domain-containing protein [Chitinophaga pinensis]|uniref:Uncharacterized protein n=1 Tax=Chitinophaga pinensis (strain ATCC 43595 / DSM 2588 / LMG 13176 / NBRC 15968 / NCIMB 11800 / UQM 2034) TaxID=485918 RepID=A0A979GAM4_CHIPD|nr:hypothetical protein [Chitinophaga pinensis]ACU63896.1 hypothetical protein Cpin_6492 [Chitinophaga pinensis DSM 2588]
MPKDQNGKFTPIKGKPSGNGKEGLGLRKSISPDELEADLEMTDKYTVGPDELQPGVHMRHPNRDTAKKAVQQQNNLREAPADKTLDETFDQLQHNITATEIEGRVNKNIFAELAAEKGNICITLYMPTHASGQAVNEQQDLICFKNILQQTQKQLEEKSISPLQIRQLLQPGYELLKEEMFWKNQQDGLACFITENSFRYLRLPLTMQQQIYCNHSFMLTPLLPVLTSTEQFYLLTFSKHNAKLFLADAFGMKEVPVEGMPNGMDDVIHFEEKGDQQLFRTGSSGGGHGANYHGMNSNPDHKTDIANYLEEVDKTIWKEVLHNKHIPLIMAAVDYLQPIFRKVTRYQHVADEALTGNFEHEKATKIYRQAREKMQPFFEKRKEQALDKYNNGSTSALTASIPDDVIPATYYGQVDCLFVEKNAQLWGTFDEKENRVIIHEAQQPQDECLLNNAITQTILHNGDVFILEKDKMPAESSIAASLRYA